MKNASSCLLVVALLAGCASFKPQEPDIQLVSVKPLNFSLSGQRLALVLNVTNPNGFDLNLSAVNLSASLAGEPIATGFSDELVTVPADGERQLELVVTAGLDVAFAQLRSMLDDAQTGLDYGITGTVELSDWPAAIPFDSQGRLENPLADQSN